MRKPNALLVALPAFVLGGLCTAALTTTASARRQEAVVPVYRGAMSVDEMNRLSNLGYEYVGQSSSQNQTGGEITRYTMRLRR